MARAVLSIRLPRSPHQIQSLIDEINNLLANVSRLFQDDLRNLEGHINVAQELLRKADEVRLVSEREKNKPQTAQDRHVLRQSPLVAAGGRASGRNVSRRKRLRERNQNVP